MFEPSLGQVRSWGDRVGAANDLLAELDLRLSYALALIAASPLRTRLLFKGGTALNKLYFGDAARLSVDLDFNAVGQERAVHASARELREAVTAVLVGGGLAGHGFTAGKGGDHIRFRYRSVAAGTDQPLKVEVSLGERFPVIGAVDRAMLAPSADGGDRVTEVALQTAELVELTATKIRALHQRRKGRDIYDLHQAIGRVSDPGVLRKLVLYYFACRGVPFQRSVFLATLDTKIDDPRFRDDLTPFLKRGVAFDWNRHPAEVREWLADALSLDESDEEFVLLVKHLSGQAPGKKAAEVAARVGHPLVHLLGDRAELSPAARALTRRDFARLIRGDSKDEDT